jgi:hypothetical protein
MKRQSKHSEALTKSGAIVTTTINNAKLKGEELKYVFDMPPRSK